METFWILIINRIPYSFKLINRIIFKLMCFRQIWLCMQNILHVNLFHYHYHVHEGLDVFPVPWSSRWIWSLHLFLSRPMFLRRFDWYFNACFGILFVSILCTCYSHFTWYCFISFTVFCPPVFFPNTLIIFFIKFCYSQ